MASLQKKGNGWYCQFLHHGKWHTFAVGAVTEEEAQAKESGSNNLTDFAPLVLLTVCRTQL